MEELGRKAKEAARYLMLASTDQKNRALQKMAGALAAKSEAILGANQIDMDEGRRKGLSTTLLDRLMLSPKRIEEMAEGLLALAALPDPVGEVVEMHRRPNGLEVGKIRVPLGVVGIIYEARPNVTADAAGLCLKTGNAIILRGGSEAFNSNQAIARVLAEAAVAAGIHEGAIQLVDTTDREAANILMKMNRYVDVLIPRGGAGLIQTVVNSATVPVIETGVGNCHTYIDQDADLDMALEIAINAKCQRPSVCNAMESLLVHEAVADEFLPRLASVMQERQVELRGCERFKGIDPGIKAAEDSDWETEFLDFILAVKVVKDLDEAMEHINRYGTGHSEAIVTRSYERARRFLAGVDAAAVFVNASTRFTDGFQFGLGAEIGISTQKLHARGPMGLKELTSTKYIIYGNGQIRQ
ncbi:MAG: glutamate-5-semialdehyde dehydrogenase [Syntrophomonadales bacterium]|jgi:glutamate-5-semialdehyde dehydrogenase